ncbi:MAG TPA: organomercurial lyase [Candidatus Binatia bacterium]|nr:organomercurial lyase [Candidatus Binatia bacterium]
MPQNVPEFTFSDDALKLRQFLYEYWCTHGHGPNLRAAHESTGLARDRLVAAFRELDLGLVCTLHQETQNMAVLKLQPFSSYPSQVEVHVDGKFHCWAGCAMESVALSRMPPFAGKEIRLESYCACCLAPVSLVARDGEILSRTPASVLIHVSTSPRDWNKTDIVCMCDSMNYVLGADHAAAYERTICRRGVLFTLEQAQRFVADTGRNRMWRYDWPPVSLRPERVIAGIRTLGVDVTNWGA